MSEVVRLVTYADGRPSSVSLRHVAVLGDAREILLLDDRGFDSSGPLTRDMIEADARTCVGPEEPFGERTVEEMEADHWRVVAQRLARHGVAIAPRALAQLPHHVVLTERLEDRLR